MNPRQTKTFVRLRYRVAIFGILLTTASTMFVPSAYSYFEYSKKTGETGTMNDIKFDEFKDFTKKWHLVTVRFRQDTKEMRLTYANDIAWREMQESIVKYSDGAAFGKVGLLTVKDPAFPSSEVPSSTRRFQLMVRNKKKYESTGGWGYALFDNNGQLFNEDPKNQSTACAACHAIVPERGFVFSRPMNVDFGSLLLPTAAAKESTLKFEQKKTASFAKALRDEIPKGVTSISSLEGPLKKQSFSGTLDEIVPFLIESLKERGQTSTFYVDEKNFTLVTPSVKKEECDSAKIALRVFIFYKGSKVRDSVLCQ